MIRAFAGFVAAALLLGVPLAQPALAQAYPTRPVRIVVPFPAAGTPDILARLLGPKLSESLGQQVIVENKPGAGGNVGTAEVARAEPDGHTLVVCTIGTCAINQSLYPKLAYDLRRDFEPVMWLAAVPGILAVHPSVPVKSIAELIAVAKAKPGTINYASSGVGSSPHLATELLKGAAGIDLVHVPYRGAGQALNDLVAGQVQMFIDNLPSTLPHVRAGSVRGLAVTSAKRSPALPDVPTMQESGVSGFEVAPWFGLLAPKGTPRAVVTKLNEELRKALNDPTVKSRLDDLGIEVVASSPAELARRMDEEIAKWAKVVGENGIRTD